MAALRVGWEVKPHGTRYRWLVFDRKTGVRLVGGIVDTPARARTLARSKAVLKRNPLCDCGRPATRVMGNDRECERCAELESKYWTIVGRET